MPKGRYLMYKSFRDQLKECQESGNAFVKPGNPVVYCHKHYCKCMSNVCYSERVYNADMDSGNETNVRGTVL
jgi:hypothetical protein